MSGYEFDMFMIGTFYSLYGMRVFWLLYDDWSSESSVGRAILRACYIFCAWPFFVADAYENQLNESPACHED